MLSDAIKSVRETFATANAETRAAMDGVFGGTETTLRLWETGARDLEVAHAAMVGALKGQDDDGEVPSAGKARRSARARVEAEFVQGAPGIARRYGRAS